MMTYFTSRLLHPRIILTSAVGFYSSCSCTIPWFCVSHAQGLVIILKLLHPRVLLTSPVCFHCSCSYNPVVLSLPRPRSSYYSLHLLWLLTFELPVRMLPILSINQFPHQHQSLLVSIQSLTRVNTMKGVSTSALRTLDPLIVANFLWE